MSAEPVTAGFDMTKELLIVVGKILNRLPNYSQKKKEEYYKLVKAFDNEMARTYENRDDNRVGIAKRELEQFVSIFSTEIETKFKSEWSKK